MDAGDHGGSGGAAPRPQAGCEDLAPARPRFPATLEKWYADALLPDGTVVLVYLGRLVLFGTSWSRTTVEILPPRGDAIRGDADGGRPQGGPGFLRFAGSAIEGELLQLEAGPVCGELRYRARCGPLEPRRPFLARGGRRLEWRVEVPDADVEGELRWPGGRLAVRGRGYRDRVFFDFLPWRFPLRRLVWGRAAAGGHAAFWSVAELWPGAAGDRPAEAGSARGAEVVRAAATPELIAEAWVDGARIGGAPPGPPPGLRLGPARTLLEAQVVDLEGLRFGPLRGLLRGLTGDPHESKRAAPCTLIGAEGRAVHEVVEWRRPGGAGGGER